MATFADIKKYEETIKRLNDNICYTIFKKLYEVNLDYKFLFDNLCIYYNMLCNVDKNCVIYQMEHWQNNKDCNNDLLKGLCSVMLDKITDIITTASIDTELNASYNMLKILYENKIELLNTMDATGAFTNWCHDKYIEKCKINNKDFFSYNSIKDYAKNKKKAKTQLDIVNIIVDLYNDK